MSASEPLIAFNCTAYDERPSGARVRAVGLAAALLRAGATVLLYAPRGISLRAAVEHEAGAPDGAERLHEIETPLDPVVPVVRAVRSERWFRRHVTRAADLFVTDYYPVIDGVRTALTIHDLRYLASPADEPRGRVVWFRTFYPRLAQRAPVVLVPTASVGSEAVFHLGLDASRVHVVPNGLSRAWRTSTTTSARDDDHMLWIGTPERRKRLGFLLRAYAIASAAAPLRPLVLAGRGAEPERLPRFARDLVEAGRVVPRGVVASDELVELCRTAAVLLHPSRYEGYGLPVVESLAVGTPVLAARIPAIEEVARGGAHLLPSDDMRAWARALGQVGRTDVCPLRPARHFVEAARDATWAAAAGSLLEVVRR